MWEEESKRGPQRKGLRLLQLWLRGKTVLKVTRREAMATGGEQSRTDSKGKGQDYRTEREKMGSDKQERKENSRSRTWCYINDIYSRSFQIKHFWECTQTRENDLGGKKVVELTLNQANDNLCPSSVLDITLPEQGMGSQLDSTYLYWGEPVPQRTTTEILKMMPSS